jgi:hypothetical protein
MQTHTRRLPVQRRDGMSWDGQKHVVGQVTICTERVNYIIDLKSFVHESS